LIDRFHVFIQLKPGPERAWFVENFGLRLGNALIDWFENDLDDAQRAQISNRQLENLGTCVKSGIALCYGLLPRQKLPLHLLQSRIDAEPVLDIEDFLRDPDKYCVIVSQQLNVANRFAALLPRMKPNQMARVMYVVLALPPEMLASVDAKFPFVFKKTRDALAKSGSKGDADAFWKLLRERLGDIK